MATTSAINPGLSALLQNLSNVDPSVASSPALQTALEKAPPSDIVQLSVAATQLQNVTALFGNPSSSGTNGNPFTAGTNNSDFTNLQSVLTGQTGPASAAAQSAAQLQNVDALFGIQDSLATPNNSSSSLESLLAAATQNPPGSPDATALLTQYQSQQQIQNIQNLFGVGSNTFGSINPAVSVLG